MHQAGKKATARVQQKIRVFLWTCICCAVAPQIGRLILKKRKASSKEHWLYTHILKCGVASLTDFRFMSSRASFVTVKQHRYRSGISKPMYHRCFCHPFNGSGTGTWNWWNVVGKIHILDDSVLTMTVELTQTCLNEIYSKLQFYVSQSYDATKICKVKIGCLPLLQTGH